MREMATDAEATRVTKADGNGRKSMKREEVKQRIADITDEQLDWLMGENGKDVTREKAKLDAYKAKVDPELDDLRGRKAAFDAAEQAGMTAEQVAEAAKNAAEEAKADYARKSNRLDAVQKFVDAGIGKDDYEGLLDSIVSDDAKATSKAADSVIAVVVAQREAAGKSVREELIDSTPKPQIGGKADEPMTRERFRKLPLIEKQRIATEQPDLYNSFYQD